MNVAILVDASTSMLFEGKIERALELGAAFGVMGLLGTERVSFFIMGDRGRRPPVFPPSTGRASMPPLFRFLETLEPGGEMTAEEGIDTFLRESPGRGVVLILSDFLTAGNLKRAFNLLFSRGLLVHAVQILGPTEREPELAGDARLVDSETALDLDVSSAADLLDLYQEYRAAFEARLAHLCRQRAGRFLSLSTEDGIDWVLFDLMRRKGWIE